MVGRHCEDRSCAEDNCIGKSCNPRKGFPEGVRVNMGIIMEQSTVYSKTTNRCPLNLKSAKVDVNFLVFISSSTETMVSSGVIAPDPKVQRLGTP